MPSFPQLSHVPAAVASLAVQRIHHCRATYLAEKADLHWTYIGGIERGEQNVSLLNLHSLEVRQGLARVKRRKNAAPLT